MFRWKPPWNFALLTLLISAYSAGIGIAVVQLSALHNLDDYWFFWPVELLSFRAAGHLFVTAMWLSMLVLPVILFILWQSSPRSINLIMFLTVLAVGIALEKFYGPTFSLHRWGYPFIVLLFFHSIASAIEVVVRGLPKLQLLASIATFIIAIGYWLMQTFGHAMAT